MRFSSNGYYLEEYVKCANCGVLIYSNAISEQVDGQNRLYCGNWCVEWDKQRRAEIAATSAQSATGQRESQRIEK